jgi:predicted RNA polymerase sigma factor
MADLPTRLGRHDEARALWQRAADLTRNARVCERLLARVHHTPPEGGTA